MTGRHDIALLDSQIFSGVLPAPHPDGADLPSPGLPEGVWRDRCIELMIEVHRQALTAADERVLRHYARQTRPKDWSEPGRGPVCYAGQRAAAEALHLSRKSLYNAERKLEGLGLVAKLTLPNGHRRGPRGSRHVAEPLGIAFYPAILAYEELQARADAARDAREAFERARRQLLAVRARLMSQLRTCRGEDPTIAEIRQIFAGLPRRLSRITDPSRIAKLTDAFQELCDDLQAHLADRAAAAQDAIDTPDLAAEITHKREAGSPRHIYTTTNTSPVDCTSPEDRSADAPDQNSNPAKPAQTGEKLGNRHRLDLCPVRSPGHVVDPAAAPIAWRICDLIRAAGPDFRAYLALFAPEPGRTASHHIVDAAAELAAALGIHQSAWHEACAALGQFEAALAVLILDANRDHPTHPVRKPGGALRAMVHRHHTGALNLDASMFALLRRRSTPGGKT